MKNIIIIALITPMLLACSSVNKEAIEKVNNIGNSITKLKNKFDEIDHKKLKETKNQYDENISYIKKYYFKDTIDIEFMNKLSFYKGIKSSTKKIKKNKDIIINNFDIMTSQISNLKEDLENSTIQGKKLDEALLNENKNLLLLDSMVSLYIENVNNVFFVHDSISGYIKNKILNF